jgi:His/Glu/Gln/Arg/opine family amino acid ABC transporter permease subunit
MAAPKGGHSCFISPMRILASFEWSFIWDNRDQLWGGFKNTIKTAAIGVAGSFLIGLVLGAVRAHRIPVLNQLAWIYVEAIRNTPILVQIFLLYYGTPELGIHLETFTVAWLAITIWGGAFNTENFRAGFEAVPPRLREAGYALGFTGFRTFLNVTLPIGGRIALPSSINTYISVLKNTSLMLVIGYPELTSVASNIQAITFRTFEMFSVLAAVYLAIVWTLSALIRLLERRLALPEAL